MLLVISGQRAGKASMRQSEKGSSLIWTSLFFALIVLPMMSLVVDATRLWSISLRIQTATDAACEDAAVSSVDYDHFQQTGDVRFLPSGTIWNVAQSTFASVLEDSGRKDFSASLSVAPDFDAGIVRCTASADVPLFIGRFSVSLSRASESSIRFIGR